MKPLIPALGAAAIVAAAIVWTPLPGAEDAAPASSDPTPAAADPPAPAASPVMAYIHFTADSAAAGGTAGAAARPGPPLLVGLAGVGRARTAYIVADGAPVRARRGDKVGHWRLASIGPHSVTLRDGGKTLSLAFYGPRPAPPPPTAAEQPASSPTDAAPAVETPAAPSPPVREHALEPASAPTTDTAGAGRPAPCYWAGPASRAPKGCIVLKAGQLPPR